MKLQWAGLVFAFVIFSTIAIGHFLVRWLHPIFGTRLGLPFILLGVLVTILSLDVGNHILSGILGILGITTIWDGIEFFRQEKRVQQANKNGMIR
jgi:hypothetical protein